MSTLILNPGSTHDNLDEDDLIQPGDATDSLDNDPDVLV